MDKKILVAGTAGFIGFRLANAFFAKITIHKPIRTE